MLINKTIEVALRCHQCGRLEKSKFNIFELNDGNLYALKCSCGSTKAQIKKKGSKYIQFEYSCFLCDEKHRIVLDKSDFWSQGSMKDLKCLKTGLEIGYYGPQELIDEELDKQKRELNILADELGLNDYEEPEILLEVFNIIHDRASMNKLYCECGSKDIDIKLNSSKIKLKCLDCGTVMNISAETEKQLNEIKNKGDIVIKNIEGPEKKWSDNKYKGE